MVVRISQAGALGALLIQAAAAAAVFSAMEGQDAAAPGVTLSVWNNSAWDGAPFLSEVRPGLAFDGELPTGSTLEMVGTLELPQGSTEYNFSCSFANTTMGFLWIDDHLVCQDGNIYKPPVSRTDLPLKRLAKASLPIVLRAYTAPSQRSRGNVSFVGNYFDGDHGKSGPRVLRFGPQSYGFSPQSCADACTQYTYAALQDVGGRLSRNGCAGTAPGTCTNETGYCSCDNDLAHIEAQGVPTDPSCLKPVQACSWVNSVYRSAPAPPPLPAGSTSKAVSIHVSWQALAAPSRYGRTGSHLTPLLPFDRGNMQLVPHVVGPSAQPSLAAHLPPLEQKRRQMQHSLATGWATWVFDDLVALASLPSAATIRPVICSKKKATRCLDSLIVDARGEGGATNVRCGSHAYDRTYAEVESLEFEGLHLRLRWGFIDGRLNWAATCVIFAAGSVGPAWLHAASHVLGFG